MSIEGVRYFDQGVIWKLECRRALLGETEVLGLLRLLLASLNIFSPPPVWVASAVIGQVASRLPIKKEFQTLK